MIYKTGSEVMWSGRISSFWSTSGTRRDTLRDEGMWQMWLRFLSFMVILYNIWVISWRTPLSI